MALTKITSKQVTSKNSATGGVVRGLDSKLADTINVKDFGAVGDGVTDDTAALVLAAAALQDGQVLNFEGGTYLISYQGAAYSSVYGNVVMDFLGKTGISLIGEGATIKISSHNITTYGGLRFANFKGCKRVHISGFYFDMTFTGTNTSGSYYPFVGAITAIDAESAGQAQSALNGDFLVEDCTFKLYHPWGQYVTTSNPYAGDANNGYKMFSIFFSGPYLGATYESQYRNVVVRNCTFKTGHNGYGVWVWAWNNVVVDSCTAEYWVGKRSTTAGAVAGTGVAFIRYHQFLCSDIKVINNNFRAVPCNDRTTAGYEGAALFTNLDTNQTGDYSFGKSIVDGNIITLGNGDSANTLIDFGVAIYCYGDVTITNNQIDGIATATNAYSSVGIYYGAEAVGGDGKGTLVIDGNVFGALNSYCNNISLGNGSSSTAYKRRLKEFVVSNNISLSQAQYFVDMTANSVATYLGVEHSIITGNTIIGTYNTVYNSADTNSRVFQLAATEATDILIVKDNIVKDKNRFAMASSVSASADTLIENNRMAGVTTVFVGGSLVDFQTHVGTFTPVLKDAPTGNAASAGATVGRYLRNGNRVYFDIVLINVNTAGLTAGNTIHITALPFTAKNTTNGYIPVTVTASTIASTAGSLGGLITPNTTYIALHNNIVTGSAAAIVSQITSGSGDLYITGSYEIA